MIMKSKMNYIKMISQFKVFTKNIFRKKKYHPGFVNFNFKFLQIWDFQLYYKMIKLF